jgi:predicted DNA-binding protein
MTTQMLIRLDSDTKSKLTRLAQADGKNTSQVIRELIEEYIQNRDMSSYMDDLWGRVGEKLRARNVGAKEIQRAIQDSRRASKK